MNRTIRHVTSAFLLSAFLSFGAASVDVSHADDGLSGSNHFRAGDFLLRVRATHIRYEDGADSVSLPPLAGGTVFRGSVLDFENAVIPEVDLTYFITKNFAVETICCATLIKADAAGAAALALPALGLTNGVSVADVWALPITLMFQYHFNVNDQFKPYVGVGPTYAIFLGEDVGDALAPLATSFKAENQWGITFQAGFDAHLGGNWFFNLDAKYMHMEVDASWETPIGRIEVSDAKLNPWLLSVGLGYKF